LGFTTARLARRDQRRPRRGMLGVPPGVKGVKTPIRGWNRVLAPFTFLSEWPDLLEALERGPLHRFKDFPTLIDLPRTGAAVYTVWDDARVLIYAGSRDAALRVGRARGVAYVATGLADGAATSSAYTWPA
jgi:hypothetical protein